MRPTPGYSQSMSTPSRPLSMMKLAMLVAHSQAVGPGDVVAEDGVGAGIGGEGPAANREHAADVGQAPESFEFVRAQRVASRHLVIGAQHAEGKVHVRKLARVDLPRVLVQASTAQAVTFVVGQADELGGARRSGPRRCRSWRCSRWCRAWLCRARPWWCRCRTRP